MHKKATNSQYLGEQAATPAPAAAVPTELKSVADIQNFLISKGFDVGKTGADGKMGKDTIAALGKFMSGSGGTTAAATPEATKAGATTKVGTKVYRCGKNPYFKPASLTWTLRGCFTANALLKDARSQYEDWKDLAKLAGAEGEKTLNDLQASITELENTMKNEVCKKGA